MRYNENQEDFRNTLENKDWMYEQYITKKKSLSAIGEMVNCGTGIVTDFLKFHNIEIRDGSQAQLTEEAHKILNDKELLLKKYNDNFESAESIARELNCTGATVLKHLRKFGIVTRSGSEAFIKKESFILLNNIEWMYEQYVIRRRTTYDISRELNVSDTMVGRQLKLLEIQVRNGSDAFLNPFALKHLRDSEWLFDQYIIKNKTAKEIAKELSCCYSTIIDYLNKYDIDLKKYHSVSSQERKLRTFFEENNIVHHVSRRNIINPKELDIYFPEHNIAIEVNGLYWHGELKKNKFYHETKRKMCEEKGI